MKKLLLPVSLFIAFLTTQPAVAQNDVVKDAGKSNFDLNKPEREEWLKNTDAGLFIHFSVDAQLGIVISHSLVGASNEYVERYFNELPKTFNPNKFDPYAIAVLAKLAGMKYIVFTTKHHSGFCMWDTKTTDFNITKTPYKKDLLKEFVEATRAAGLEVGLYFSPEDFSFLYKHHIPISRSNVTMDAATRKAYDDYTRQQCVELMKNYGKIDVFFIDGEPKEIVKEVCWKIQPDLLITRGAINTPEQMLPGTRLNGPWLSPITIGTAWQYQPTNERYKSGTQLINLLIEARSKGGSLLLNVGPKSNGELPQEEEDRLREVAAWYFVNHECVDNVRPWVVGKEDNIIFTAAGNNAYAIVTGMPDWKEGDRKTFILHSVKAGANTKVSVLGQNSQIMEYRPNADVSCRMEQTPEGLSVSVVRTQRIYDDHRWPNPVVIKLENINPAINEAVIVETGASKRDSSGLTLNGRVYQFKEKGVTRARFAIRPYGGQVETLYAGKWKFTDWVNLDAEGRFSLAVKEVSGAVEYKAIAQQSNIDIDGENRVAQ